MNRRWYDTRLRAERVNSLNIIPQTSIELERAEHDWTIAVLIIFVS